MKLFQRQVKLSPSGNFVNDRCTVFSGDFGGCVHSYRVRHVIKALKHPFNLHGNLKGIYMNLSLCHDQRLNIHENVDNTDE